MVIQNKYAYGYRYDGRGNVVKKLLPGCKQIQHWYDRGNRLSFMQDANLRDKGQYRFYLYDKLERTVVQGLCNGCNRSEEMNIAEFKGRDCIYGRNVCQIVYYNFKFYILR